MKECYYRITVKKSGNTNEAVGKAATRAVVKWRMEVAVDGTLRKTFDFRGYWTRGVPSTQPQRRRLSEYC